MKTEMQVQFVEFFCLTGNATKSATMAGYSEKTAYVKGCQLKKQFAREIAEQTQQMIVDSIPGALSQLKNLAESAQSESVRLGAVKDILDRAGLKPVDRVEQTNIEAQSTDELRRELELLMGVEEIEAPGTLN
jgi:phage terminase small subunit